MACLLALAAPWTTAAQPQEEALRVSDPLAAFQAAVAIGADPAGRLYVLDAAAGTVTKLDTSGAVLAVWGGAGSGAYAFDQPADLDPTNGLVLYVADAGNRLVKRYSSEFLHLESLALDMSTSQAGLEGGRGDPGSARSPGDEGRPVAVRASLGGDLYALDEERGVVVKWNAARRVERVFGGYDAGEGALRRPVALDLGPDGDLYVADPGRRAVVVFDRFGNFRRTLAEGAARGVRRVLAAGDRVFIVLPERVLVYDAAHGLRRVYRFDQAEPLQGVAVAKRTLYLLTATRLLAARF